MRRSLPNSNLSQINELRENNLYLQSEIVKLNKRLDTKRSTIKIYVDKFQYYQEQLKKKDNYDTFTFTFTETFLAALQSSQLSLRETQIVFDSCEKQLGMYKENIDRNEATISKLITDVKLNNKKKLEENQKKKQNKLIQQQQELEVFKLAQQINPIKYAESKNICSIKLQNIGSFLVLKNNEIAGPDWIVIQQRINGQVNFNMNWQAYRAGFGYFTGDFFLGLEKIYQLTKNTRHELYIHMEPFEGGFYERRLKAKSFFAHYDNFRIAGEDDKYRLLRLGVYTGSSIGNRLIGAIDQEFVTYDSDNFGHIPLDRLVGWWQTPFW